MTQGVGTSQSHPLRAVDLGREEDLVTWNEWMMRCAKVMQHAAASSEQIDGNPVFRVTLADKRQFMVSHVFTQVARGKCSIGPERWADPAELSETSGRPVGPNGEPICDVITGYVFVGTAGDGRPTTLGVPPEMIASVECVLMLDPKQSAFGFARWTQEQNAAPVIEEVDDTPTLFDEIGARVRQMPT